MQIHLAQMAEKVSEANPIIGSSVLPVDLIKTIADSLGITNLQNDAAKELADDVTFRLKVIVQDALKFIELGKKGKMCSSDFDHALKLRNIEVKPTDSMSFRYAASGIGKEISEEKEQDIQEIVSTSLPKVPAEPSYRTHWLAVEGMQPAVPENPAPYSKSDQQEDSVDPARKLVSPLDKQQRPSVVYINKTLKTFSVEKDVFKQLATYEPSVEQQLYYKEITEACVGSDELRRTEALQSLANDPGLYELLPKLCTFISEGVRVNVVQYNLALLIYLMRMVKALLENQTFYLEKYLHEIIPSVATCIVSKQLCLRPEADNHWALRDFASRLMAQICRNYTTSTNSIQTRITRIFSQALTQDKMFLPSVYGAIAGLGELGPEVINAFIVPTVKHIGERLAQASAPERPPGERKAAAQVKDLIIKYTVPVVKDNLYRDETVDHVQTHEVFGEYLANIIITQLEQRKQQEVLSSGSSAVKPSTPVNQPSVLKPFNPSSSPNP